jgi:hypothetical protein
MQPSIICSLSSRVVNEPLFGTAPRGDFWMLLEYDGIWGKKAFKESNLPELVKSHLNDLLDQIPFSKLLLIRQHLAHREARQGGRLAIKHHKQGIRFYMILASEQEPRLYAFSLEKYEDLLEMDIPGAAARTGVYEANISGEVLALICTNGRRDWCCARYGPEIYQEIVQLNEESSAPLTIWQSSHLGGHRFAPNIACFPQGYFYGRVEKDELQDFLSHIRQGKVYKAKARGRACYPAHVQAAEMFIRQRFRSKMAGEYQLIDAVETQPGEWVVRFKSRQDRQIQTLEVLEEITPDQVYKSCNDPDPVPVMMYRLGESKNMEA